MVGRGQGQEGSSYPSAVWHHVQNVNFYYVWSGAGKFVLLKYLFAPILLCVCMVCVCMWKLVCAPREQCKISVIYICKWVWAGSATSCPQCRMQPVPTRRATLLLSPLPPTPCLSLVLTSHGIQGRLLHHHVLALHKDHGTKGEHHDGQNGAQQDDEPRLCQHIVHMILIDGIAADREKGRETEIRNV